MNLLTEEFLPTTILDKIAPVKKLTKREAKVKQVPWLTMGILKSINGRDSLHKKFLWEKIQAKKATLFSMYKIKRNMIVPLIRSSKKTLPKLFSKISIGCQKNLREETVKFSMFINKSVHAK